jgi:hypothetical protein
MQMLKPMQVVAAIVLAFLAACGGADDDSEAIESNPMPLTTSFTQIPYGDVDLVAPGRGAEQWHNGTARIPNPTESQPVATENSMDVYYRFEWARLEGSTLASYNWTYFDGLMRAAINRGQKLSFGIMTHNGDGGVASYAGGSSSYPLYLHDLMQAEAANSRDWLSSDGVWVPNWNSPNYLARLRALHEALYAHLMNTTYVATAGPRSGQAVAYRDAIYAIDIRGYGNWGEWHSGGICDWNGYPAGRQPTAASLKKIIDHHTEVFDLWPLVMMVAGYDGGATSIPLFVPLPEVAHYALTASNAWGDVGFRRDQWGATDGYLHTLMAGNTQTYNGSAAFNTFILDRYKTAPVTGEPMPASLDMTDLENQVQTYHATSVGNGNYGAYPASLAVRDRIRAAFKRAGYRIVLESGSVASSVAAGGSTPITLAWQNVGIAPTYEDWDVVYELRGAGGAVVAQTTSSFSPTLFAPHASSTTVQDSLDVPGGVAPGTYGLFMTIKDPAGYRAPLPLAITGRNADGSYTLGSISVTPGGGGNQSPIVNAGMDKAITLPTSSTTLTATASDPDGTIASYSWVKTSGPAATLSQATSATLTLTGLVQGTYVFSCTVTDNQGATAIDGVQVTVNPASGATQSLWADARTPTSLGTDDLDYALGTIFRSTVAGKVTHLRVYAIADESGAHTARLWRNSDNVVVGGPYTWTYGGSDGWITLDITDVNIDANTDYTVSVTTGSVGKDYPKRANDLASAGSNGANLTYPANAGVYSLTPASRPTSSYGSTNYLRDVVFLPAGGQSLWADARIATSLGIDNLNYELGTIFRSTIAGKVTHLRVYAVAAESGTHTARLWRNSDNVVLGGPYTWSYGGSDGWITLDITDVNIAANTDYTVSVTTGSVGKTYPKRGNDLASAGSNGANLTYPANAGVYSLAPGSRPTSSSSSSNYLRDVVFTP